MRKLPSAALLLCALLGLSQCKKASDPDPVDQLPPATQTGANTFGCLVNGQAWTPKGYNGTANYSVAYDPRYRKGTLNVAAYRYNSSVANDWQSAVIYSDSIKAIGTYSLSRPNHQEALFHDFKNDCEYSGGGRNYCRGILTVTRLDAQAGIISGTFSFTLYKPGCNSIKVTQGRFDRRL